MKIHNMKHGYSPFAVLRDWLEVEMFGKRARAGFTFDTDDDPIVPTAEVHWTLVCQVFHREQVSGDHAQLVARIMKRQLEDVGDWWVNPYSHPVIADVLNLIADDVKALYYHRQND